MYYAYKILLLELPLSAVEFKPVECLTEPFANLLNLNKLVVMFFSLTGHVVSLCELIADIIFKSWQKKKGCIRTANELSKGNA